MKLSRLLSNLQAVRARISASGLNGEVIADVNALTVIRNAIAMENRYNESKGDPGELTAEDFADLQRADVVLKEIRKRVQAWRASFK